MPSPFTRYTGEQIQPINILPYTAQIADNIGKGIAAIGEGIGAYSNYQAKKEEEKSKASYLANGVLQQYMEQDGPEDDATGEVSYKVSDTAPSHVKELFKKSQKQPDGVSGLSTTDLTSFLTLQSKYEQDEQIKFERGVKQAGVDLQKAQLGLAEREFGLRVTAQEQDYKFRLRDFEWRVARGEKGDELDKAKLALEKDRLALEQALGPARAKLIDAQARQEAAKAVSTERALSKEQAKEEMTQIREGIPPTEMIPIYGEKTIRSGVIQTPDGLFQVTDDIDQFLKESGLKEEDLSAPQAQTEIPYSTSIARTLSGDAKFDPSLPAVNNPSKNKKQFVQGVYEQLIQNFPEQRATIDHQFKWNAAAKGENKNVELDKERYDLAVKYSKTQQFQDIVGKNLGVKREFAPIEEAKAPTGVRVISQEKTSMGTIKEVVAYKTDQRIIDESYDAAFKQFKARNQPFPMTRDEAYKAFNLFGGLNRWTTDSGKVMYTNERGETKSKDELEGMGLTRTPTTEYGLKRQAANNWVRRYVPDEKSEGRTVGNYTFTAQTRNKEDPMSELGIVDPEAAQKEMVLIETNLNKADEYVDKMKALWNDVPIGESLKPWSDWQTEYTTLQRGLETFRKYFIAPGTETERDADRLAEMMVEPRFKTFWQDPEKRQEALDMVRNLIANGARAKADAYGITIKPAKGIQASMTNEEIKKRIEALAGSLSEKYPDKYQKKQTK